MSKTSKTLDDIRKESVQKARRRLCVEITIKNLQEALSPADRTYKYLSYSTGSAIEAACSDLYALLEEVEKLESAQSGANHEQNRLRDV
jgi:hypothetical protein